jgi:hypothetical protein
MTTYYFADDGNDGNSGLTTSLPKTSLSHAATLVAAGNEILFKCGDRWQLASGTTGWAITGKVLASECLIGVWNDDVSPLKPLFDGGTYLTSSDDANWTHLGAGVWQRTLSATVTRIFAGTTTTTVTNESWGEPMSLQTSAGNVNAELEYHNSSGVITIYTGSVSVAPPTFYDGLLCIGNGRATAEGVHLLRCQNVTLENLRFANAQNTVSIGCQGTNDSDGIILRDVESHAASRLGSAFRTYNTTASGFWVRNTELIRCLADNHTAASENDNNSGNWGSNNGISFTGQLTPSFEAASGTRPSSSRTTEPRRSTREATSTSTAPGRTWGSCTARATTSTRSTATSPTGRSTGWRSGLPSPAASSPGQGR